jgi:hypothetical protein
MKRHATAPSDSIENSKTEFGIEQTNWHDESFLCISSPLSFVPRKVVYGKMNAMALRLVRLWLSRDVGSRWTNNGLEAEWFCDFRRNQFILRKNYVYYKRFTLLPD